MGLFHESLIQRQLYWADPAEHVYYMAEIADLLGADQRQALVDHLLKYPQPQEVATLPPDQGARREASYMEPSYLKMKMRYERESRKVPVLYNLYAVDRLNKLAGRKLGRQGMGRLRPDHGRGTEGPRLGHAGMGRRSG